MYQRYKTLDSPFVLVALLLFAAFSIGFSEAYAQTDDDWQNLFGQGTDDDVHAVVQGPGGEVYVGGEFSSVGTIKASGLAMWDGTQWHNIGEVERSGGDAIVYEIVLSGDILFVGGRFSEVVSTSGATSTANNIAALDLTSGTWMTLEDANTQGRGVTHGSSSGSVGALALDGSTLYVGGAFDAAGGREANNIAVWNMEQETWSRLQGTANCNGVNGSVNVLINSDALYAGGAFTEWEERYYDSDDEEYKCRDVEINRVAKFSGGSWSALGGGVGRWSYGSLEGSVFALVQDSSTGDLYVGGEFAEAFNSEVQYTSLGDNDYISSNNVARWDGTEWHPLGGGTQSPQYAGVGALLLDGSELYVGGSFQYLYQEDGMRIQANGLALWDGSAWTVQEGEGQDAWGNTELWTTLGTVTSYQSLVTNSGGSGVVRTLAQVNGDVFIGGSFSDLYREPDYRERRRVFNIGRWDGEDYYALGTGLDGPVTAAAGSGTEVYLAGDFEYVLTPNSNTQVNRVTKFDPTSGTFTPLGDGILSECPESSSTCALEMRALEVDPQNGDLYLGGAYVAAGTSVIGPDVFFHWDGSSWNAPSGLSGPDWNVAPQIHDLHQSDEQVYIVGSMRAGGQYGLAQWNKAEQQFEEVYDTPYQASFRAVRWHDDQLYLVRSRDLLQYDLQDEALTELASFSSTVEALALLNETLYVGGQFDEVTYEGDEGSSVTESAGIIAGYETGSGQWSFLDGGLQGSGRNVHTMLDHDGKLYVGGQFDQAGSQSASLIAAWDPAAQAWSPLGSGIQDIRNTEVHALASAGDRLFVGGDLLYLGDNEWSPFLAAWHDAVSDAAESRVVAAGDPPPTEFTNLALRLEFSGLDQEATVTAERFLSTPVPLPEDRSLALGGSWTIEQSGATSFSADVCFSVEELIHSEEAVDFSQLEVHKRASSSASWELLSSEVRPDETNPEWVCALGVTGFSEFVVVAEESALPVELASFEAAYDGGAALLSWQTLSESGNAGFEIERAVGQESSNWQAVGFVEGAGTASEAQSYSFTDSALPFEAERVRYRLRQLDRDGQATVGPEVELVLGVPEAFALHGNFPNPFAQRTAIRYELPEATEVRLEVYDLLGRRVAVLVDEEQQAGRKEVAFEAMELPSGVYLYRLSAGGTTETQQMVVVR